MSGPQRAHAPSGGVLPRRSRRRALIGLGVTLSVLALAAAIALVTIDRWLWRALDPGLFDAALAPPAPDYTASSAWAALPERDDGADLALAELPRVEPDTAAADVFYLHPTTALGPHWNAAIDTPEVIEATERGGTLIQASVFNGCCAVYAPRYRQAHGRAFTHPDTPGGRARDLAYADVSAAFDSFIERSEARGDARPFILAGHSQGSVLGARLLRERIAGQPVQDRLVAAYLIGAPLQPEALAGVPVCAGPRETGCVVSWNARSPEFEPNALEFNANNPPAMRGLVCVNPITWARDEVHAPADASAGAVFFDSPTPRLLPGFADAGCRDGMLIISAHGELERDFMSRLLLRAMGPGNYHPIEYQLHYADLRRNASARVEAFAEVR